MRVFSCLSLLVLVTVEAAPFIDHIEHDGLKYASEEARKADLPLIKLPYATIQAQKYDKANDVRIPPHYDQEVTYISQLYVFKNIRFGAPPIGPLRFSKPAPPAQNATLQTGAYGPACIQGDPLNLLGLTGALGTIANGITNSGIVDIGLLASGAKEMAEDCLFLDVLVPSKALKGGAAKLPIVNWIYGGAYIIVCIA